MEGLKAATGEKVDYEPSQTAAKKFPKIAPERFAEAVQWVGTDGKVFSGAKAMFCALATGTWYGRALLGLYARIPIFARLAEAGYGAVARNRSFFSLLTRMLWGNDVRTPTYALSSWIFLRALGAIYLVAFLSFGAQLDGLIGAKGILPASAFFEAARGASNADTFLQWPSLLWWTGAGDAALHGWCWAGVAVAALLMVGILPAPGLIFLWATYLSLVVAGQDFYFFQWDSLLLEVGFLAIFLAPWEWWSRKAANPPRVAHFLLIWLLFRFIFASGVVKLSSGDPTWTGGTALEYHYFTQPLPTPLAWYAQQLPGWFQWLSVKGMFFVELFLSFLLFLPRRLRLVGAGSIAGLQVLIMFTGNYGFFNFLTLALCVLAVDDVIWGKLARGKLSRQPVRFVTRWVMYPAAAALFSLSLVPLADAFRTSAPLPVFLVKAYNDIRSFRTVNFYGLFSIMTKQRNEIVIQGSDDAVHWKNYVFRYKPGDPRHAPPWVAPYMPRLDWQLWFASLGGIEQTPWFVNLMLGLLDGSPAILDLFKENPFPERPPRYVRAMSDAYTFTSYSEARETGAWWKTEPMAIYYPEVSLKDR